MAKREIGLYELINEHCNAPQIEQLLRAHKHDSLKHSKEIKITGTKDEVIANLKRAISLKLIPIRSAIDLLRECEENGRQHIFYYKPKTQNMRKRCRNFDSIIHELLGEEWDVSFPLFEFQREKYKWVDARDAVNGKPKDWVLKAYGEERQFKLESVKTPDRTQRIEYYRATEVRAVCLVRWNDPDLLEVRIDSQGLISDRVKRERLKTIWNLLAPALNAKDFGDWELAKARAFVMGKRRIQDDFCIGDLRIADSDGGTATFKTGDESESIDNLPSRSKAIEAMASDADCRDVRIHWTVPQPFKQPAIELSTICGGRFTNELSIGARTTAGAIDHVTNRLRALNA